MEAGGAGADGSPKGSRPPCGLNRGKISVRVGRESLNDGVRVGSTVIDCVVVNEWIVSVAGCDSVAAVTVSVLVTSDESERVGVGGGVIVALALELPDTDSETVS